MIYKILQCNLCLVRGHRPVETIERTGVLGKRPIHQRDHLAGSTVRRERRWCRQLCGTLLAKALAVVGIEIPAPTQWLTILHQQAGPFTQGTVEMLQPRLLALCKPVTELRCFNKEMRILDDIKRQISLPGCCLQGCLHPRITGLQHGNLLRRTILQICGQRRRQRVMAVCIQRQVAYRDTACPQAVAIVPHSRKEQYDSCLVTPDVRRFLANLRHKDEIAFGVECLDQRMVGIKLVTQNDHQSA